jgi:hypothetical protein
MFDLHFIIIANLNSNVGPGGKVLVCYDLCMNMFERHTSTPESNSQKSTEKKVSDLGAGDSVIRDGELCIITSYRPRGSGIEISFSDGGSVNLDGTDTLDVPA